MSWASRLAFRNRRRTARANSSRRPGSCRIELDRETCAAGDVISGLVAGLAAPATVVLVRVELDPDHHRLFEIADARTSPPEHTFQLTLPRTALPSTRGRQCRLAYVVRVQGGQCAVAADLAVIATAQPHLDIDSRRSDRLLANWDARRFHIELVEARLEGAGRIAGRVHRHRAWAPGTIDVKARCLECWRICTMASRSAPQWRSAPIWEQVRRLCVDPDATWAPFAFELPDRLPSAVEASTIAWRYELVAQRNVPHWFKETAAVTPLLHEQADSTASVRSAVASTPISRAFARSGRDEAGSTRLPPALAPTGSVAGVRVGSN